MGKRSKLLWPNVVCHPWAIVVYNVEQTLDQRRNAISTLLGVVPLHVQRVFFSSVHFSGKTCVFYNHLYHFRMVR